MYISVTGNKKEFIANTLTNIFPEHHVFTLEAPILWSLRTLRCDVLIHTDTYRDHAPVDLLLCRLNEIYPELIKIIRKRSKSFKKSYSGDVKPWLRTVVDDSSKPITRSRYLILFAQGLAAHKRELMR